MAKITRTTVKNFIKKNIENLYIKVESDFNGMTDCVEFIESEFKKVTGNLDLTKQNTLGLNGVWFVGQSRDRFAEYNANGLKGYCVNNSCGSWIVATK